MSPVFDGVSATACPSSEQLQQNRVRSKINKLMIYALFALAKIQNNKNYPLIRFKDISTKITSFVVRRGTARVSDRLLT
jgi:hypothetical protein